MAYVVKNTKNQIVATVNDGAVDNSTSLSLIGRNYVGYGLALNTNFMYLLENFTGNTAPSTPVTGQLWYDGNTNDLKIYNGAGFVQAIKQVANLAASGNLDVTGNANVGNLTSTAAIKGVTANITGAANVGSTLDVVGNITAGNVSGTLLGGTLTTVNQPNITSVGTLTSLAVTNDLSITTGNLSVAGYMSAPSFQNGNSNVSITANSNVSVFVAGNTTARAVFTSTGANIAGTANVTGNANVGNLGTATAIITTGNITTINSGLVQNSTSNVTIASAGNVSTFIGGNATAQLIVTATGANIAGTANIATANITTINSGLLQNSTSNVTVTSAGNVSVFVAGNATARAVFTSTGANIAGTANVTGNANVGNLGTATAIITTGNITTINSGLMQNGNSNVTITANSSVTIAVTAANSYTFATGSFAPSSNAAVQLGLTGSRWSNVWGVSSSALYADLAEKYQSDADYEPGTVLEIGGEHEITVCNTPFSNRVFGCVSTDPAYLMNDNKNEGIWLPVVLTGRAPIRVAGTVNKGDRLVSAGNGAAMAAGTFGSSYQTEIGRALESKTTEEIATIEAYISTR